MTKKEFDDVLSEIKNEEKLRNMVFTILLENETRRAWELAIYRALGEVLITDEVPGYLSEMRADLVHDLNEMIPRLRDYSLENDARTLEKLVKKYKLERPR